MRVYDSICYSRFWYMILYDSIMKTSGMARLCQLRAGAAYNGLSGPKGLLNLI